MKTYFAKLSDYSQADYTKMYSLLECAIREKIDAKKNPTAKQQSILAYSLLYKGIEEIYPQKRFKITFNQNGKPQSDLCFFSISHSEDVVVCAFYDQPIGVDIQKITNVKIRKKYKFFTQEESCYVNQNHSQFNERYIEIFAKKEAAVKMLGLSLGNMGSIDTFSGKFNFKTIKKDGFLVVFCIEKT